jgi:hypothetical protein
MKLVINFLTVMKKAKACHIFLMKKIILPIFSFRSLGLCLLFGQILLLFPGCSNMFHKKTTEKSSKDNVLDEKSGDANTNMTSRISEKSPLANEVAVQQEEVKEEAKISAIEGNDKEIEENFIGDINENPEGMPEAMAE